MRAHRLAVAARTFADVTLAGPVEPKGLWPALPPEPWIKTVPEKRFPGFTRSFLELADLEGDVLLPVKPYLSSYGVALVQAERKQLPVILDLDDLDLAFVPRSLWEERPSMTDLRRPASAIYLSLLTKAVPAASAITVSSSTLQSRFGGTLIPHGSITTLFDPSQIDRNKVRKQWEFQGPTVLFAGTPRWHKGLKPLAKAVQKLPGARLAVLCRAEDLGEADWRKYPLQRLPLVPYSQMPHLLAAADLVAIPQLNTEAACYQMPMKVYDCMAMGKPIVASAISDLPQLLEGRGKIVPPGDSNALAEAIAELLWNPEQANALGRHARSYCLEHFTMERIGRQLQQVVRHVLP